MEKEYVHCSSLVDIKEVQCHESYAGISNICVVIIEKVDSSNNITPEVIHSISEKYNIPIERIYTDKSGYIGMKIDLQTQKNKCLNEIPLIGHFEKDHSITLEPDHKAWYTRYDKKRKH